MKLADLDEKRKRCLKDLGKKYYELEISRYGVNPPKEIFENLSKGTDIDHVQVLSDVKNNIFQKYRNEFDFIREIPNKSD